MDWKKLFLNLGAAAAGGFSQVVATAGGAVPGKGALVGAIVMPVLMNLIGLFQQSPHQP